MIKNSVVEKSSELLQQTKSHITNIYIGANQKSPEFLIIYTQINVNYSLTYLLTIDSHIAFSFGSFVPNDSIID